MGIETRHDGKLYYYRKKRVGNKVVSEYVGGGLIVDLESYRAEQQRQQKQAERERLRVQQMSMAEIDQQLDDFSHTVDMLMEAELVARGFHQHKSQWRKKRDGSKP